MTLLTRRGLIAGAAGLAAPKKKKRRWPVGMQPDQQGVFFQLIVQGGGTFTYDAAGNLRSAEVGQTTTDPLQGITCYAGISTFNGHGAVISLFSSTLDAQLWYADTGTSTQGALAASVASATGTDPFGNGYLAGDSSYLKIAAAQFVAASLTSGQLTFYSATSAAGPWSSVVTLNTDVSGNAAFTAAQRMVLTSNAANVTLDAATVIRLISPQTLVQTSAAVAATSALLEVQGDLQAGDGLSIGQGAGPQTLVNGSTISTAGITMQPVTAAAAVTGIILQAGTFDGQMIVLPSDASGVATITFAAAVTSNVRTGTGAVIQPGKTMVLFWVASRSLWYELTSA